MSKEFRELFQFLAQPGERFPRLGDWLLDRVWSRQVATSAMTPDYLSAREARVNEMETLLAAAAPRAYDELCFPPDEDRDLRHFLLRRRPCAAVVLDGMSLREIPAVLALAAPSRYRVAEVGLSFAALPSETVAFVAQRLGVAHCAPSQLPEKKNLREQGIAAHYFSHPTEQHRLEVEAPALLLWSAFPDNTYRDSGARFAHHFAEIQTRLEIAWRFTVQQLPRDRPVLITSDHGYVFFGPGLSAARSNDEIRPLTRLLGGERFKFLEPEEPVAPHPDLVVKQAPTGERVAMIRGRVQTHPPGDAANKLYKHGGLSLMEMLTPWIVLEPE
ncbi:MAG TPA: hypothetical protein VFD30_21915 [Terriglobia bacterium]|nr:hypothetical protein [Terriglobia bacterium]